MSQHMHMLDESLHAHAACVSSLLNALLLSQLPSHAKLTAVGAEVKHWRKHRSLSICQQVSEAVAPSSSWQPLSC